MCCDDCALFGVQAKFIKSPKLDIYFVIFFVFIYSVINIYSENVVICILICRKINICFYFSQKIYLYLSH